MLNKIPYEYAPSILGLSGGALGLGTGLIGDGNGYLESSAGLGGAAIGTYLAQKIQDADMAKFYAGWTPPNRELINRGLEVTSSGNDMADLIGRKFRAVQSDDFLKAQDYSEYLANGGRNKLIGLQSLVALGIPITATLIASQLTKKD